MTVTIITHHINDIPVCRTASVFQSQPYNPEARGAASPAEALIGDLQAEKVAGKVIEEYKRDGDGHITTLFVADKRSIDYLNQHPDILLLDCTCKTNKFNMPLVNVLGIDDMGRSFSVAFASL